MSAATERRYLVWICHGCAECTRPNAERTAPCDGPSMSGAWVRLAERPPWMSEDEWRGRTGRQAPSKWAIVRVVAALVWLVGMAAFDLAGMLWDKITGGPPLARR